MRSTRRVAWLLIVCCLVPCALLGVTSSFDDDPAVSLCPTDDPLRLPDETGCALSVADGERLATAAAGWSDVAVPGLLAAVPGGLCLLI